MSASVWLLVGLIGAVLLIAALIAIGFLLPAVGVQFALAEFAAKAAGSVNALVVVATCAAVLAALITYLQNQSKAEFEQEEARSRVLLNQARETFEEVVKLLEDQNNDRVTWIRAGRVLLEARGVGLAIRSPTMQQACRLLEDRIRNVLYRVLTTQGEAGREALPPQFFYGLRDWKDREVSLDQAEIESSAVPWGGTVSIDRNIPRVGSKALSVDSVIAIFDFLEFPADYKDPLDDVKPWTANWHGPYGESQGARRYVAHQVDEDLVRRRHDAMKKHLRQDDDL